MEEKKKVTKATAVQQLKLEDVVTVIADGESGIVTGIAFDSYLIENIEGEVRRWIYRVNNGWYTYNQLVPPLVAEK